MDEVVGSVKQVTGLIGEIADANAEQTAGLEQVNQAVAAMDQATQQNAALVGQRQRARRAKPRPPCPLQSAPSGATSSGKNSEPHPASHAPTRQLGKLRYRLPG
ncbi:hypothetical protein [Duganella sp. CF402]|nr:hypothetical protein [Duganella sp. CF402]